MTTDQAADLLPPHVPTPLESDDAQRAREDAIRDEALTDLVRHGEELGLPY